MISLAIAAALALQAAPETVTLVRGGTAHGIPLWDFSDTTLDASAANSSLGADAVLSGGSSRTILIRFGDLDRVVRPNQRITKATLVFTQTGGDKAVLRSAGRVLVPWGEGPYQTLTGIVNRPATDAKGTDGKKPAEPEAPRGSATWRMRNAGDRGAAWQQPGAQGPADTVKIEGAQLTADEHEVRIEGLAGAAQEMVDHPFANFGLALSFDSNVEFGSGQGAAGRPRLVLELENAPLPKGPDLSVVAIERRGASDPASYVAHIKNVGDAPATGFSATWYVEDRAGVAQELPTKLAPGEETTITTTAPYRVDKGDHRLGTVGLRIRPASADANPRNDGLTIFTAGRPVEFVVSKAAAAALSPRSAEDWVQDLVRRFNDVYLAQSRFSFAPEGARERVTAQRVTIADAGSVATGEGTTVQVSSTDEAAVLKSLALAIGVPDLSAESVSPDRNALSGRGGSDRFPGLMGYGDTRFEGLVQYAVGLPYEAYPDPGIDAYPPEAIGLLAATDVATLNAALGDAPVALPKTVLLRFRSQGGEPLANTPIEFYQTKDGRIGKEDAPRFSLTTGPTGAVFLPMGETGPFAKLEPSGGNGALLMKATINGVTEWTWIKAWQLLDFASRGNRTAAIVDVKLPLPTLPLETETNLAADRIVTDSAGSVPAKLAALIDGDNGTESTLGAKPGDWIEIDLGRDRTIGEVDLVGLPGGVWSKFDLVTYATGQRPEEAQIWTREIDSNWTFRNRRHLVGGDRVSVPYRGKPRRFRFLRIINRGAEPGRLSEIRVVPAKVSTTP